MKKYLTIITILLFFNSSCETEKLGSNSPELIQFELAFTDDYKTLMPFDFAVDWSTAKEGFSEDFNADIFEFDVIWTGVVNPEDISLARKKNSTANGANYNISYKIIATKKGDSYNFYVAKFTTSDEIFTESLSLFELDSLDGYYSVYNKASEKISSKSYINGKFFIDFLLKEKENVTKRCSYVDVVTIHNYYNLRESGPELNFTRMEVQTYSICDNHTFAIDESNYGGSSMISGGGGGFTLNIVEDVILEDKIDFDTSFDPYPCQKTIITNALDAGTSITDLIQNIFNSDNNAILTIKTENLNGILQAANTTIVDPPSSFLITFNSQRLSVSTDFDIVNTAIHESIHATLFYFWYNGSFESSNESYAQLVKDFTKYQAGFGGNHHEYMTSLVNNISDSSYNWAINNGYSFNDFAEFDTAENPKNGLQEYLDILSWGELTGTDTYNNLYPEGTLDRKKINDIINSESLPYESNANPKGAKCN